MEHADSQHEENKPVPLIQQIAERALRECEEERARAQEHKPVMLKELRICARIARDHCWSAFRNTIKGKACIFVVGEEEAKTEFFKALSEDKETTKEK